MGTRRGEQSWNSDGSEEEWLRLIDFIDPGSKAVKAVIAQAKARAPNGEFPAYVPPDNWRRTIEDLVNLQVEAIYETLRERRIGYAVERWDSRPPAQVIRTHEEVLDADGIGGPCIDLAILMAACLEAVGIQPIVVVLERDRRRHAVLGYRTREITYSPESTAEGVPFVWLDEKHERRVFGLIAKEELQTLKESRTVGFLDCTALTKGENVKGDIKFSEAREQALGYIESGEPQERRRHLEQWHVVFALDVKAARHTTLTREIKAYLGQVKSNMAELPSWYPADCDFPQVRVEVQARQGQRSYSESEERAREMARREQGAAEDEGEGRIYGRRGTLEDSEVEATRPVDWDREVRDQLERGMILGDPGYGKTWLLKHEAWQLAGKGIRALEDFPLKTGEVTLPVFLRLSDLAATPGELGEAILDLLAKNKNYRIGPWLEDHLRQHLSTTQCRLLLDALDEVPAPAKSAKPAELLGQRLEAFARNSSCQIWLTSRLVGYQGPPIPLSSRVSKYELLPFDQRQQRDFVRAWFAGRPELVNPFLRDVRANPQLRGLGQAPLLLALLCLTYDDAKGNLPMRRAELYQRCLEGFLRRKWKPQELKDPSLSEAYLDAKRELAEELACRLFIAGREHFSSRELRGAVRAILEERPFLRQELRRRNTCPAKEMEGPKNKEHEDSIVNQLVDELTEHDGLLIKAGAGDHAPYLFFHLTFQEYLTASALARRTQPTEQRGEEIPEWLEVVKAHLFDTRWEMVITLLASKVEDATQLIRTIWDEPEDTFLGRLVLLGKCLVEARAVQGELRSMIIEELLGLVDHPPRVLELPGVRTSIKRVLGLLATSDDRAFQAFRARVLQTQAPLKRRAEDVLYGALGFVQNQAALDTLIRGLEQLKTSAALALGEAGHREAIPALLNVLNAPDLQASELRATAVWALARIGQEEVASYLLRLLADASPSVRSEAALSLRWLGTNSLTGHLFSLLEDPVPQVRGSAALALGRLCSSKTEARLVDLIAKLIAGGEGPDGPAALALAQLGHSDKALDLLIQKLEHPGQLGAKEEAAGALGILALAEQLPPEHAQAAVVPLLRIIRTGPKAPRVVAQLRTYKTIHVPILGSVSLPSRTSRMRIMQGLPEPLYEALIEDVATAAWALGAMRCADAVPYLVRLVSHEESGIRAATANALGRIGQGETHLLRLLRDSDPRVVAEAAKALARIGDEKMLHTLLRSVRQPVFPWHTGFCLFWTLLRWRKGSTGVLKYGQRLEWNRWAHVEALGALWSICRRCGIRLLPNGKCIRMT